MLTGNDVRKLLRDAWDAPADSPEGQTAFAEVMGGLFDILLDIRLRLQRIEERGNG